MKVNDVVARQKRHTPSVKDRVLAYVSDHPDELFTYRDADLLEAVGSSRAGLGFALWSLHKSGAIEKCEWQGRAYFGMSGAIAQMKERLQQTDPWERARANSKRIFERHGRIDVLQLLDEVRGSWE